MKCHHTSQYSPVNYLCIKLGVFNANSYSLISKVYMHINTGTPTDRGSWALAPLLWDFSNSELRGSAVDIVLLTLSTCYSFTPSNAIFPWCLSIIESGWELAWALDSLRMNKQVNDTSDTEWSSFFLLSTTAFIIYSYNCLALLNANNNMAILRYEKKSLL